MKCNQLFPNLGTLVCLGAVVRAPWAQSRLMPGVETLSASAALKAIEFPENGTMGDLADYFAKVGVGASITWGELNEWLRLPRVASRTVTIAALRAVLARACDCSAPTQLNAQVQVLGLLRAVEMREPRGLARARLALRAELAKSKLIPLAATATESPDDPITLRNLMEALGIDAALAEKKAGLSTAAAVELIKKAIGGDDHEFDAGIFADMLGISRTVGKAGVEAKLRELANSTTTNLTAATIVLGIMSLAASDAFPGITGIDRAIAANRAERE